MNLSLGYLFVTKHIVRVIVAVMAEALGESFSLEDMWRRYVHVAASVFDREPAKVWVVFAQARATNRILIHI
jgi:hypothetical protein